MKNNYLSILLLASLSCAASDDTVTSQFEGYTEAQNLSNEPIQFAAIGSGFNYQGELLDAGTAVSGNFDFAFGLYDALIGGTQIGSNVIKGNRPVANGIFSIEDIDFGNAAYTGDALWLSVTVRETGNPGSETTLSPRQKIHAVPYAVQAEFGATPWTENGSTVSYNGSAELTGTAQVSTSSNGGLSVGNTAGSHMTIDGDDIQRRINGSNDPGTMFLNFYGGDVRLSKAGNNTVVNGGLKQSIDQSGVMKYMVDVFCNSPTAVITKSFNGVNTGNITVSNSPGGCIINFPTDINDRFFQASPRFATSGNSTNARAVQCRIGDANNQLLCNYFRPNSGDRVLGSFMVLIY